MEYEQIRQSAKMRLCRALSSAVLAPLRDGIEKVRGSTPLISTIQNRAKARFFAFREWGTGCLGHPGSGASSRGAPLQRAVRTSLTRVRGFGKLYPSIFETRGLRKGVHR